MRRAAIVIGAILLLVGIANRCQQWWIAPPVEGMLAGQVVGISDGDSITVLDATKTQHKVRLVGIDAPETGQAFGKRAKQALSAMLFRSPVVVEWTQRDRYGRILGDVRVEGRSAGLWMVQQGFAWHYTEYSRDEQLAAAEAEARDLHRGLWADGNAIAPWEFRRNPQAATSAETGSSTPTHESVRVYVTENGTKYHAAGCRFLGESRIAITLGEARSRYSACSVCGGGADVR